MSIKRWVRPLIVAAGVLAFASACGDKEATPGQPAAQESETVPTTVAQSGTGGTSAAPHIVFFDRDAALQNSLAGRSILQQAQQLRNNAQRELTAEGQRWEADARLYQQQAAVMAANVRAQRQRELQNRQNQLRAKAQQRTEQIQAGFGKALQQFSAAMEPVLGQIMKERGANILMDRRVVVMSQNMEQFDITRLAVQRLDRTLQRVPVALTNPTPPQQPGAQQPARPPGQ